MPASQARLGRVLARRSRHERATDRQLLGPLHLSRVERATLERYKLGCHRFFVFLRQHEFSMPSSARSLDRLLCEFIEELWQQGDPRSWVSQCLSGISFFLPHLRHSLAGAHALSTTWARQELPARAPPLVPLLVYAIADYFRERQWQDTLVCWLLCWHTLSRPGEAFFSTSHSLRY